MPGARHDLLRPAQGHHSPHDLRQRPDSGAKTIRDIKEQEVFYGDIPLMTENGTFNHQRHRARHRQQLHRSPGVFSNPPITAAISSGKIIPIAALGWSRIRLQEHSLCPHRSQAPNSSLHFLRALGMKSNEDILRTFYQVERISLRDKDLFWNVSPGLVDRKLTHEIRNPKSDEVIVGAHKRINDNC